MYIIRFIKNFFKNLKYQKILNRVYEDDQIIAKLSYTLGVQFHKDWIGRLYAVINPAIKDGKYDQEQVFEYLQDGYDTTEHTKAWVMQKLSLMQNFIQTNNLFDILGYEFKQLDEAGNYLFVVYPITLPDTLRCAKWACWEIVGILLLVGGYFILTKYTF